MKWIPITSNSRLERYELWNTKEKLLILNYHPDKGTLRLTTRDEQRVFLIGKEGFLRSRPVLRNEYGVRTGQIASDGTEENQGWIEIHDEEYNYLLQNSFPLKAAIYRNTQMLTVCELPADSRQHELLLLMLCWYISTSIQKHEESYSREKAYA